MFVEIDGVDTSRDAFASLCWASDRSIELMEIISIDELRGDSAGTNIIVATRRKAAKDNPSIISSSVIVSSSAR